MARVQGAIVVDRADIVALDQVCGGCRAVRDGVAQDLAERDRRDQRRRQTPVCSGSGRKRRSEPQGF